MATIKKACKGAIYPKSSNVSSKLGSVKKAKSGTSFGMLSVKAGIDKNPNPTAADRIAGAKMNAGKAKKGAKIKKALMGEQIKSGTKQLPGVKPLPPKPVNITRGKQVPTKSKPPMKTGGKMTKKCAYGCK